MRAQTLLPIVLGVGHGACAPAPDCEAGTPSRPNLNVSSLAPSVTLFNVATDGTRWQSV